MSEARPAREIVHTLGALLQYWRKARSLSQLALAHHAEISARHLSFIETGRSKPSRDMVLLLASVLDVPLRERNALLLAAGFAPAYRETSLDAPELAAVRLALDAILRQHEPFPAVVMNRHWDVLAANVGASRFFGFLLGEVPASEPRNVVRLMFHPERLRPHVTNWTQAAEALVRRIHREAVCGVEDDGTRRLLEEVFAYPGVPETWRRPNLAAPLVPIIPVSFAKDGRAFDFFSTVTTLGTPQDVTLQEIRLECFFPVGDDTARRVRELAEN